MFEKLKISEKILAGFFIFLIVILLFVYTLKIVKDPEEFRLKKDSKNSEIIKGANLASQYCVQEGGKIDVIGDERYCVFSNGRMCDEWDYFRGLCSK
jgi:putative hemolysin